jgi:hypothetical protein
LEPCSLEKVHRRLKDKPFLPRIKFSNRDIWGQEHTHFFRPCRTLLNFSHTKVFYHVEIKDTKYIPEECVIISFTKESAMLCIRRKHRKGKLEGVVA